jgi:hypothetical protein
MDLRLLIIRLIPVMVLVLAAVIWLFIRKTIRTRLQMATQLKLDPQINDWLIIFNWSRKVLYVPTIIASLIAAGMMFAVEQHWGKFDPAFPGALGGAWLAIFFLNFLIDEYELNVKVLLLAIVSIGALMLWLALADLLTPFFNFFKHLGIEISSLGYLMLAMIFLLAIVISWVHGLFYYVTFTPNYLAIQNGPTETGEQMNREGYNTRIETSDFLERLLGFGQVIITFSDTRRPPLVLLVSSIGKRAKALEAVRGHLAVEAIRPSGDQAHTQP